jgi:hypothetical protein
MCRLVITESGLRLQEMRNGYIKKNQVVLLPSSGYLSSHRQVLFSDCSRTRNPVSTNIVREPHEDGVKPTLEVTWRLYRTCIMLL